MREERETLSGVSRKDKPKQAERGNHGEKLNLETSSSPDRESENEQAEGEYQRMSRQKENQRMSRKRESIRE